MARHPEAKREQALQETRRKLLQAAAEEFAANGYQKANINDVARAAGFSVGTVYNYFESKRALMLALIEEVAREHVEFVKEAVLQETDPKRRMARFFEAGFAFVSAYLPQAQAMANNLYGPDAEFKEELYQAYLPMFEMVGRDIVGLGVEQGMFRELDPDLTARMVMNIYLGTASQVDAAGRSWFGAGQVADLILNGLRR